MSSVPGPPEKRINVWTIAVEDAAGSPVVGAAINAVPFMPAHGHPSSMQPKTSAGATVGTYVLDPIYFFMAGVWRVTIDIKSADGSQTDSVQYFFCVSN